MKNAFKKMIIFVLITMTLFNSIVPCNVFAAGDYNAVMEMEAPEGYVAFELKSNMLQQDKDGKYVVIGFNKPIYTYYIEAEEYKLEERRRKYGSTVTVDGYYTYTVEELLSDKEFGGLWKYLYVKEEDWEDLQYIGLTNENGSAPSDSHYVKDSTELTTGAVKPAGEAVQEAQEEMEQEANEDPASLFETLITIFLITLGDGAMWAIGAVCGGEMSLDTLIFNKYPNTSISIFKNAKYEIPNNLIGEDVLGILEGIYNTFTAIAVATFLTSLLYIGLKILFGSTGVTKAKYQDFLITWVKGVIILFTFPIVMRLMIDANVAIVEDINTVAYSVITGREKMPAVVEYPFSGVETSIEFGGKDSRDESELDYMGSMRKRAWDEGRALYALCWLVLIGELVKFIIIYFKRALTVLFLIAVFPLVTMTYAIDKVGDGKSQAFSNWFKEFTLNVFMQTFHAINYVIIMGLISVSELNSTANYILIILGISYLSRGDKILWSIFGQKSVAGSAKSAAETVLKTSAAVNIAKRATSGVKKTKNRITKLNDFRRREITDRNLRISEDRLNRREADFMATHPDAPGLDAFAPIRRADRRDMSSVIDTLNSDASEEAIVEAAGVLNSFMEDPAAREEMKRRLLAKGVTEDRITELFAEQEALKNLEVDVKNNLNILINRRKDVTSSLYNRIGAGLLLAYGLDDNKLLKMKSEYDRAEAFKTKNEKRNRRTRRAQNARRVYRYSGVGSANGEAQEGGVDGGFYDGNYASDESIVITGYARPSESTRINDNGINRDRKDYRNISNKRKKKAKKLQELRKRNIRIASKETRVSGYTTRVGGTEQRVSDVSFAKPVEGTKTSNGAFGAPLRQSTTQNKKKRYTEASTSAKRRYDAATEARYVQATEGRVQKDEIKKRGRNDVASSDPIRREYTDTGTSKKPKTKQDLQKRMYSKKIREIRKEQLAEKARERQTESTADRIMHAAATAASAASTEGMRRSYSNMARHVVDASAGDSTTLEKILAKQMVEQDIKKAESEVTTDAQREAVEAAAKTARSEIKLDRETQTLSDNVDRMILEYVDGPVTDEVLDTAVAVEIMNSGSGTLDELWDSYHVVRASGIERFKTRLIDDLGEYEMNLAVETLNNSHELGRDAQDRVDEAIRIVRAHQHDGGVYRELLKTLRYNPAALREGEMPGEVARRAVEEDVGPIRTVEKSSTVKAIERRLREEAEERDRIEAQHSSSIYDIQKKFDADNEKGKRRKAVIRLTKNVAKEVVRDTSAFVGAATAFAAYEAVDQKHNAQEIVASIGIGAKLGTKLADTAIYYGEETVDAVRNIRDKLSEDRDGRNPIKLNKK